MKKIALHCKIGMTIAWLLSGCETPQRDVQEMPDRPFDLKHEKKLRSLHFSSRSKHLSADEEARLLSAIQVTGPGKCSTHITLPKKGSSSGNQHLKEVIRIALKAGVKAKQIHRTDDLPRASGGDVEVIINTYCAIPPLCPNWQTQYGTGYDRGTTSNFGCSTAHNLLLMIEDPIVLFKGEKATSREAAADCLPISDHRTGRDRGKWLKSGNASSSSSSGSSASAESSASTSSNTISNALGSY